MTDHRGTKSSRYTVHNSLMSVYTHTYTHTRARKHTQVSCSLWEVEFQFLSFFLEGVLLSHPLAAAVYIQQITGWGSPYMELVCVANHVPGFQKTDLASTMFQFGMYAGSLFINLSSKTIFCLKVRPMLGLNLRSRPRFSFGSIPKSFYKLKITSVRS